MKICVLILTFNEELHLERAIASVNDYVDDIIVVDSFSTDKTLEIAEKFSCKLFKRHFDFHYSQFNWALAQIKDEYDWVLRLDADEYISRELGDFLRQIRCDTTFSEKYAGVSFLRNYVFQDTLIKWGGVFPVRIVRLFQANLGKIEPRYMDEQIIVDGPVFHDNSTFVDHNLNDIEWWKEKHRKYAMLEALNESHDVTSTFTGDRSTQIRRSLKKFLPKIFLGVSFPISFFVYRAFFRLGFLDGKVGLRFHYLHAFWYRNQIRLEIKKCKQRHSA